MRLLLLASAAAAAAAADAANVANDATADHAEVAPPMTDYPKKDPFLPCRQRIPHATATWRRKVRVP